MQERKVWRTGRIWAPLLALDPTGYGGEIKQPLFFRTVDKAERELMAHIWCDLAAFRTPERMP